jgi:hypothetical protein
MLRNVNFKGLKSTQGNIVRFSSPSASGTDLRGKYQHLGLNFFSNIKILQFCVHKKNTYWGKSYFQGIKIDWGGIIQIFIEIIF